MGRPSGARARESFALGREVTQHFPRALDPGQTAFAANGSPLIGSAAWFADVRWAR